jgi:hypothetical protein
MKIKYFIIPVLLLLTGCIGVNRQFSEVKNKILGKFGNDYKTEFQFSVGSAAINISSMVVGLADDHEYVDNMMREISSVQIGVYNRIEKSNARADFSMLQSIDDEMSGNGLKYIVRSIQNDELTAIYINNDPGESLSKMFIINLHDDELVMVEVNGDLKQVIAYAIEERSFQIKM